MLYLSRRGISVLTLAISCTGAASTFMAEAAARASSANSGQVTQADLDRGLEILREATRRAEARNEEIRRHTEALKARNDALEREFERQFSELDAKNREIEREIEFGRQVQECRVKVQGIINEHKKLHTAKEVQDFGMQIYSQFVRYRDKHTDRCPI